jgi:hypothetical protein
VKLDAKRRSQVFDEAAQRFVFTFGVLERHGVNVLVHQKCFGSVEPEVILKTGGFNY